MPASSYGRLLRQLKTWPCCPHAVLVYVDLRHMRSVNRLSSPAGADRVIADVGRELAAWAGGDGIAQRLWSNEFVAVKPVDHAQAAVDETMDLRDRLGAVSYASLLGDNRIAVSIGLVVTGPQRRWDALIAAAAEACELAKTRGLNQIVSAGALSAPPMAAQVNAANVLEFRQVMAAGELVLHPQPIMSIGALTPRLRKAEFLLRRRDGEREVPLPAGMIESLEYFGLTSELDAFTAQQLLAWIVDHPRDLERLDSVSMNLSAKSIVDGRFMDQLLRDVRGQRVPRGKLCFEITETAAIEHLDVAADVIDAFRRNGCRFALDDFGSGLCSFGYLHSLQVDEVKIDGRFVRDVAGSPVSREIVRAIHQVAKATGKQTVAEFVDEPRKLVELRSIGVDFAQGWLFHPAVPQVEFLKLLDADHALGRAA
jgi:EAL domain-containing protein (putative c-di-GMP-specific phosphodiesterase class I)/GGDEF domain-containing protein